MGLKSSHNKLMTYLDNQRRFYYECIDDVIANPSLLKEGFYDIKNSIETKKNLAATIAAQTFVNPIYARIETTIGNLSNIISIKSRLIATTTTLCIIPPLMKLRETLKKKCGITKESRKSKITLFDAAYSASIILPLKPITYLIAGEIDALKIIYNSLLTAGAGAVLGPVILYIMDSFKDLVGVDNTGRLPKFLKNKSKKFKRNIAIGYATAGLLATIGMYIISPNNTNEPKQIPKPAKESNLFLNDFQNQQSIEEVIKQENP